MEIKTEIVRQRGNCTSLSYPVVRAKALLCEGRGCACFKPSPLPLSLPLQEESEAFSHDLALTAAQPLAALSMPVLISFLPGTAEEVPLFL